MVKTKKKKARKSTRKTFKSKGSAKKAQTKGRSVYKVKGGYRLTKKRKTTLKGKKKRKRS